MEAFTNPWILLQIFSKVAIYWATATTIGGGFMLMLAGAHKALSAYIAWGAAAGIIALLVNFLAQTGDFSANGFSGMFDQEMLSFLWHTPIGTALQLRLAGLFCILLYLTAIYRTAPATAREWLALIPLYILATALLGFAFSRIGHISELPLTAQGLITLHVIAACGWAGSLIPLWLINRQADIKSLHQVMHQFGLWASGMVAVLATAGIYLLLELLGSFTALFTTHYGQVFTLKLCAVCAMLLLAAKHKWSLVPALTTKASDDARLKLGRSIALESALALIALVASAVFTTALGPES